MLTLTCLTRNLFRSGGTCQTHQRTFSLVCHAGGCVAFGECLAAIAESLTPIEHGYEGRATRAAALRERQGELLVHPTPCGGEIR